MSTKRRRIPGVITRVQVVVLVLMLVACAKDDTEKLINASMEGRLEEVTRLLDSGVDVNAKDNEGDTPLMAAAYGGQLAVANLLSLMALMPTRRTREVGRLSGTPLGKVIGPW